MAITLITQPSDFGRVFDQNRLMYKMSSTNAGLANFRFYINVYIGDITQDPLTYTNIGVVRKRPLPDGSCYFNPAEMWSNYLSYDLEIGIDELKEALNSNGKFSIAVAEEFGEPPSVINESIVQSNVITLYNGLQEYIPYDIESYGGGNNQFVMSSSGVGGFYLTDATNFQVDVNDYSNLYFLSTSSDRPTHARIKVYYWGVPESQGYIGGGSIVTNNYITNPTQVFKNYNTRTSAPNPIWAEKPAEEPGDPPTLNFRPVITSYYTGFTLTYTNTNNQMYYIPSGPKELNDMGIFDYANSSGRGDWVSYQIDLTNGLSAVATTWNYYPMIYLRVGKCDKYNPIQLFWLNPHGGFDRYTFYKKNYISYDVERTLWEHRFSETYQLGERGTTVYKTKSKQNIEMNTDWLSASEAQTLSQLELSPEVYAVYEYKNNVYKIPYIINDTSFDYKEIKNEKMVSMKINITPAWNRVSQTS